MKNIGQVGACNETEIKGKSRCNSLQPEERLVKIAFEYLKVISKILRKDFSLDK